MILLREVLWGRIGADAVSVGPDGHDEPVVAVRVGEGYKAVTVYMTAEQAHTLAAVIDLAADKTERMAAGEKIVKYELPVERLIPVRIKRHKRSRAG